MAVLPGFASIDAYYFDDQKWTEFKLHVSIKEVHTAYRCSNYHRQAQLISRSSVIDILASE
jgi:hypothetical protein